MGDYANDVRRRQEGGVYPKRVDGRLRTNARRVLSAAGSSTFQVQPDDCVLIVNTGTNAQNAIANLPPLTMVKSGQIFIIQNCDPTGIAGASLSIVPDGTDLINEAPGPIVFTAPNTSRKLQRVHSVGVDSWYTVCCAEEELQ